MNAGWRPPSLFGLAEPMIPPWAQITPGDVLCGLLDVVDRLRAEQGEDAVTAFLGDVEAVLDEQLSVGSGPS